MDSIIDNLCEHLTVCRVNVRNEERSRKYRKMQLDWIAKRKGKGCDHDDGYKYPPAKYNDKLQQPLPNLRGIGHRKYAEPKAWCPNGERTQTTLGSMMDAKINPNRSHMHKPAVKQDYRPFVYDKNGHKRYPKWWRVQYVRLYTDYSPIYNEHRLYAITRVETACGIYHFPDNGYYNNFPFANISIDLTNKLYDVIQHYKIDQIHNHIPTSKEVIDSLLPYSWEKSVLGTPAIFTITRTESMGKSWYCGYVTFKPNPLSLTNDDVLSTLWSIPPHGITYCETKWNGTTYGFDTMDQWSQPDLVQLINDTEKFGLWIMRFAKAEEKFYSLEEQERIPYIKSVMNQYT